MEEKLYFEPSGHKKKNKQKDKEQKQNKDHRFIKLILFLVFIAIAILVIVLLLRGKDTFSGRYPENVRNESLTCEKSNENYDKASLINLDNTTMRFNLVFNDKNTLKTISLIYTAIFPSEADAYATEAVSHAHLNKNLEAAGLNVSKFNNKYARYNNKLILSLTANSTEIDELSAPFFMIKTNEDGKVDTKDLKAYRFMYEAQGFVCHDSLE